MPETEVVMGLGGTGPLVKECRSRTGACGVMYEGRKDIGDWRRYAEILYVERGVRASFPTHGRASATLSDGHALREHDVEINPLAHLACLNTPKGPALAAPLQREHSYIEDRETDHFAVLCAMRVGEVGYQRKCRPRGQKSGWVKKICE